jgi:hypothetical protein
LIDKATKNVVFLLKSHTDSQDVLEILKVAGHGLNWLKMDV